VRPFLPLLAALCIALPAAACEMMQYRRVQASPHVHVFEAAEGSAGTLAKDLPAPLPQEVTPDP
jgi:hypothetical protein